MILSFKLSRLHMKMLKTHSCVDISEDSSCNILFVLKAASDTFIFLFKISMTTLAVSLAVQRCTSSCRSLTSPTLLSDTHIENVYRRLLIMAGQYFFSST